MFMFSIDCTRMVKRARTQLPKRGLQWLNAHARLIYKAMFKFSVDSNSSINRSLAIGMRTEGEPNFEPAPAGDIA